MDTGFQGHEVSNAIIESYKSLVKTRPMRICVQLVSLLLIGSLSYAQSDNSASGTLVTDNSINAIVQHNGVTYIGGSFQYVGARRPFGTVLDAGTGQPPAGSPSLPNGPVYAVVSDGAGGWYIGGEFSSVGGVTRNNIARISQTGTLLSFDANVSGPVYALALSTPSVGSPALFVGGQFSGVGGSTKQNLAAVNPASGALISEVGMNADDVVRTIAVSGDPGSVSGATVYLGGDFTSFGPTGSSVTRLRLASFNFTTSTSTSASIGTWNPNANGRVNAIAVNGSSVFVGGAFTQFGGSSGPLRTGLAELDGSGAPTSWTPNPNNADILALTIGNGKLYVGGNFTNIAGSSRNSMAAFNLSGLTLDASWVPQTNSFSSVRALTFYDDVTVADIDRVYAAGDFVTAGSGGFIPNLRLVALDAGNATKLSTWVGAASGAMYAVAPNSSGSLIYAGGDCLSIGGLVRSHVAALDANGELVTSFDPAFEGGGTVNALLVDGGTLYMGGDFQRLNNTFCPNLAAWDLGTNTRVNWQTYPNDIVYALAATGNNIYVGGNFTNIDGQAYKRLAAFDKTSRVRVSWNPDITAGAGVSNAPVRAIAVNGSQVIVGGDFTDVGADKRYRIAAFTDAASPSLPALSTSFKPSINSNVGYVDYFSVNAIAVSGDGTSIFVGGKFENVDNGPSTSVNRTSIAAFSAANGNVLSFSVPYTFIGTRIVKSIRVSGNIVYLGGTLINSIVGANNIPLASVDLTSGAFSSWAPDLRSSVTSDEVRSIGFIGSNLMVGGLIRKSSEPNYRSHLLSYPITTVGWIGGNGGSWNNASNWSPSAVPTSTTDVNISSGYPVMDVDHTVGTGKSMTISSPGSLVIDAGKRLTIEGTANFGGRPVTLKSTSAGTASIGQITGSLAGATNVTVERYIPAGRKWRLLTAPLTGSTANTVFANWQNNGAVSGATGVDIWGPGGSATPSTGTNGLQLGPNASMRGYASNAWTSVTNTKTSTLFDGTTNDAYAVFVTGPFNDGGTAVSTSQPAQATTLTATGTLITGEHTKTIAATSGHFYLVGNPYASPVNPASFTGGNISNLAPTLYMWDAKVGGNNGLGRYVNYDITNNVYAPVGAGTGYQTGTLIQSGQAFFVQATATATATLKFLEASKGTVSNNDMLGNSTQAVRKSVRIQLEQDGMAVDGAMAFFHSAASASLDAMDGVKLLNSNDNMGLRREGRTLVFEHRPDFAATDTLQIVLSQMQRRTHTLRIACAGMQATEGYRLELVDSYTQKRHEISLSDTTNLDFTVDANLTSTGERFLIVMSKGASAAGTALEPSAPALRLRPYPNPLTGATPLRVDLDPERAPWSLRLVDISGRTLWMRTGVDGAERTVEIDMSAKAPGVYHLETTDGRGSRSASKVLKQ